MRGYVRIDIYRLHAIRILHLQLQLLHDGAVWKRIPKSAGEELRQRQASPSVATSNGCAAGTRRYTDSRILLLLLLLLLLHAAIPSECVN